MKRPISHTVAELMREHTPMIAKELNRHTETVPIESKIYCLEDLRMSMDVQKMLNDIMTDLRLKLNGRFCSHLDFVQVNEPSDDPRDFSRCKFVAHTPKFTE